MSKVGKWESGKLRRSQSALQRNFGEAKVFPHGKLRFSEESPVRATHSPLSYTIHTSPSPPPFHPESG